MKKREQMTFEIDLPLLARLEVISRKLKMPMDVLIVAAHVRYYKKHGIERPKDWL